MLVNGSGLGGAIQSNGTLYVYGQSHLMGNVGVRSKPYNHIALYAKGNDLVRGIETNGSAGIGPMDFLKKGDLGATNNSDMEAIRNLSKLANDLTKNGKLVVPGGLEIKRES